MADLDTSRAPRGVLTAQSLVAAVVEQGDLVERHYLELKSTLNLATKRDKEKIAKFILGASNRMPDVAATAFEGYAAMVIGISKGVITGIPPVEMMEIAKIVQKYVGAAGPRWDVVWAPIEGSTNQVLLVVVDPPMFGQGPFPCRADGDSLTSGRIYIRAEGETREANAEEFDLLLKRGAVLPKAEVDFAVEVFGEASTVSLDDNRTVDQYLRVKSDQLLAAIPSSEPPVVAGFTGTGAGATDLAAAYAPALQGTWPIVSALYIPEERTEEEYRAAIDHWGTQFRASWAAAKSKIVASQLLPTIVKITNRTTTFFQDVQVNLHLEGEISAVDYIDPEWADDFAVLNLSQPPRKWGPRERTLNMPDYSYLTRMMPSLQGAHTPPSVSFKNGGSVDVHLDVGELRPLGTYESEDEEFVLVVADETLTSIRGTWQLTARDHNEVYTGEIDIPVAEARDVTAFARQILELDRGETNV